VRGTSAENEPSHATRNRLMRAALELLVERGYRGATSRQIAQAAGVSEVTLFRLFSTKDELISEAIIRVSAMDEPRIPTPTGELETELKNLALEFARTLTDESSMMIRLLPELSRLPAIQQSVNAQALDKVVGALASFFRYYQDRGELDPRAGEQLWLVFLGPLFLNTFVEEVHGQRVTFDPDLHVQMFLNGCRKR
jgi:AcrR family transcriptional regulator